MMPCLLQGFGQFLAYPAECVVIDCFAHMFSLQTATVCRLRSDPVPGLQAVVPVRLCLNTGKPRLRQLETRHGGIQILRQAREVADRPRGLLGAIGCLRGELLNAAHRRRQLGSRIGLLLGLA